MAFNSIRILWFWFLENRRNIHLNFFYSIPVGPLEFLFYKENCVNASGISWSQSISISILIINKASSAPGGVRKGVKKWGGR